MLEILCPNCQETLHIPEKYLGTKGKCRKCNSEIVVESPTSNGTSKANGTSQSNGAPASNGAPTAAPEYGDYRNPNILILHIETTGPSSRKCNMIELGCIKVDRLGREVDTYWTFCNPDQHIPGKIAERTGISDDMVAAAPYGFEVSKEWFDWAGPNPIIITDHAHFHAKFMAAPLLHEDIEPPVARIIDVAEWARVLKVPAAEYKLRPLLESIGAPIPHGHHRALETCKGIQQLAVHLVDKEATALSKDGQKTLFSKILHKGSDDEMRGLYRAIVSRSQLLSAAWGASFYEYQAFQARVKGISLDEIQRAAAMASGGFTLHMPEWFDEKRHMIKGYRSQPRTDVNPMEDHSGDAQWEFALIEASQSESPEEKRQYLMKAVDLHATDPRPYEQMIGFYIREKKYEEAHEICARYFETDNWKQPQFVGTSLKMLEKFQKLENKLAKHF
ncbi:MAG: 3'-5' exonuclease [Candidatus Hydrogenedentota bacterium]